MPQLTARPGEPDEYTIPNTLGWERQRELNGMRRLRIHVERGEAKAATLTPKRDLLTLSGVDTVRLTDIEKGGSVWTLVCYSLEWDANRTVPSPGGDLREGTDAELITDAINAVPSWSAGTINSLTTGLAFVFSHAQPHEIIRRLERNVAGELRFRDGGTVDYLTRLGSDKTGSVELSPSSRLLEDSIRITDRGRELDGTHIAVLGAHEGEAQYRANLVPQDDPATYENEVRYDSGGRWSDSADTDWDRWENKDVADQSTLEEEAAALGDELTDDLVEAEATLAWDAPVTIGDTVQVVKADADLDRAMRVHRLTERVERNGSDIERSLDVLLSTRTTLRRDGNDDLRSIRNFETGYQGASVWNTVGPIEQNVEAGEPLELEFYYPEIAFENLVELNVNGLAYRYYVSPNEHDHTVSISDFTISNNNSDFETIEESGDSFKSVSVTGGGGWQDVMTFTPSVNTTSVISQGFFAGVSGNSGTYFIRLINKNTGTQFGRDRIAFDPGEESIFYNGEIPEDCNGDTVAWQIDPRSTDKDFTVASEFAAIGQHTHTLSISDTATSSTTAGVSVGVETTTQTPSNADVVVNGTTVANNIGSGVFDQQIDLKGELTQGAYNTVEVTTDSPGRFFGAIDIDAYKQIGKRP